MWGPGSMCGAAATSGSRGAVQRFSGCPQFDMRLAWSLRETIYFSMRTEIGGVSSQLRPAARSFPRKTGTIIGEGGPTQSLGHAERESHCWGGGCVFRRLLQCVAG